MGCFSDNLNDAVRILIGREKESAVLGTWDLSFDLNRKTFALNQALKDENLGEKIETSRDVATSFRNRKRFEYLSLPEPV